MEYIVGVLLALVVSSLATFAGFDRHRVLYPFATIMIASYYCLFAIMGGTVWALWQEALIASLFAVVAIISFKTSLWLTVAALAGHGAMDLVHYHIVSNSGVPSWWPGFCASVDITLAMYLALHIAKFGEAKPLLIEA